MKKNNKIILCIIMVIFIYTFFTLISEYKKDNIYYRVYSNNEWSPWYKNGETAGDLKNNIKKIEIKSKKKNMVYYEINTDGKWSNELLDTKNDKKVRNKINGVKFDLMGFYRKKYDVFYRTYNKKDKWMGWSWNYINNGNKKEPITGIEIYLLRKDSDVELTIKDYNNYKKQNLNYE